jgi:serine/threonine protein kinase
MDADRYVRVKEIFGAARALPEAERAALLARECGADEALRVEVEDLLKHSEGLSEEFLQGLEGVVETPGPERLEVPGFRMIELLDAGGSGIVYRAEQLRTRREVAIKVLRLDTLAAGQVARFQREAEILARLSHPGIAQVFEAGVAETAAGSLPWIAMEFVRGRALSTFVAETHATPRAILEIFIALCGAVDHAHGRGVVHRDLKPSNVLVDADGRPKVLDFGIARPLEDDRASIEHTRTGLVMGTLAYMAPEQARGEREAIGVRADVYALGVMLFECLTGQLPLDLDAVDVLEGVRIVSEVEPIRLRSPDRFSPRTSRRSSRRPREGSERYASAGALAGDLGNLLADRPVLARRPTVAYQVRKFVRRNRFLTASASVVVLALRRPRAVAAGLREAARADGGAEPARRGPLGEAFDLSAPRIRRGAAARPRGDPRDPGGTARGRPRNPRLRAALARALHELGNWNRRGAITPRRRATCARVLLEKLVEEAPSELRIERTSRSSSRSRARCGATRADLSVLGSSFPPAPKARGPAAPLNPPMWEKRSRRPSVTWNVRRATAMPRPCASRCAGSRTPRSSSGASPTTGSTCTTSPTRTPS